MSAWIVGALARAPATRYEMRLGSVFSAAQINNSLYRLLKYGKVEVARDAQGRERRGPSDQGHMVRRYQLVEGVKVADVVRYKAGRVDIRARQSRRRPNPTRGLQDAFMRIVGERTAVG